MSVNFVSGTIRILTGGSSFSHFDAESWCKEMGFQLFYIPSINSAEILDTAKKRLWELKQIMNPKSGVAVYVTLNHYMLSEFADVNLADFWKELKSLTTDKGVTLFIEAANISVVGTPHWPFIGRKALDPLTALIGWGMPISLMRFHAGSARMDLDEMMIKRFTQGMITWFFVKQPWIITSNAPSMSPFTTVIIVQRPDGISDFAIVQDERLEYDDASRDAFVKNLFSCLVGSVGFEIKAGGQASFYPTYEALADEVFWNLAPSALELKLANEERAKLEEMPESDIVPIFLDTVFKAEKLVASNYMLRDAKAPLGKGKIVEHRKTSRKNGNN